MKTFTIGWLNKCRCGNKSHTVKTARGNESGLWDDDAVKCNSCGRGGVIQVCEGQARVLWETDEEMAEGKPMSTITKEQAQKIIDAADAVITTLAGTNEDVHPESDNMLHLWDALNDRYAPPEVVRELARIALASLEAEAVAWMVKDADTGEKIIRSDRSCFEGSCQPLYTAPPAPVSVPDENGLLPCPCCGGRAEFDYDDDNLNWISCNACGISTDTAYHTDEDARDKLREIWNRRAAMLHGADGNSPVIPDGWVLVPEEPTHEMLEAGDEQFGTYDVYRRMIAASPQQEVKS
ncbi:TPA: Lar family restriction alleviation protein [Enterobacter chengduensis]|nr:Lar family restriction alleviation protein [Enterobacter chengduensis]